MVNLVTLLSYFIFHYKANNTCSEAEVIVKAKAAMI